MPQQANVKHDIIALIDRKDLAVLKKYTEPWLPADLAPIIADLPIGDWRRCFVCVRAS